VSLAKSIKTKRELTLFVLSAKGKDHATWKLRWTREQGWMYRDVLQRSLSAWWLGSVDLRVGPREHKHDLEKGLVVYGNTGLREDGEKKGLPKRGVNAETEGRAYTGLRRRGSR